MVTGAEGTKEGFGVAQDLVGGAYVIGALRAWDVVTGAVRANVVVAAA